MERSPMECKSISLPSSKPIQSPIHNNSRAESNERPTCATVTTRVAVAPSTDVDSEEAMDTSNTGHKDHQQSDENFGGIRDPFQCRSKSCNGGVDPHDMDGIASEHLANTCGNSETPIKDFYRDATVLITGGTGFVGKVLIQKLLRTFEVRRIYMLIRCKNNMTVEQRLQEYFNETVSDNDARIE